MGAKAFEVDTEKALMASVLATMHVKYRFVFEAMPGDKEAVFRAEIEAVDSRANGGWIRIESMSELIIWLNGRGKVESKGVFCLEHQKVMLDGVCPKCVS